MNTKDDTYSTLASRPVSTNLNSVAKNRKMNLEEMVDATTKIEVDKIPPLRLKK